MREGDKEYLEYWLSELKHEIEDYRTELNTINNKKNELRLQKKIIGDLLLVQNNDFSDTREKFKNHFDFDGILSRHKEINSYEQQQAETELEEKILFTELAIQKVESILENTPV